MGKVKRSQKASAREMRRAVAYDRLAAKAFRNGEARQGEIYAATSVRIKRRAESLRERGQ